ncbi:MAG TPA: hypothetical protein VID27_05680 [Blastocatellia bacterium]|jgi:hypothetical protein
MRIRELTSDDDEEKKSPAGAANLNRVREAGSNLIRAGADAINRALSANSRAFLESVKQQGGQ